jgi:hypothetical protein
MLYLRRALVGLRLSVGGIPPQISHRETPPAHEPTVCTGGSQVPSKAIGQSSFAALTESGAPNETLAGHTAIGALRCVKDLRPIHSRASLPARSSKRYGPLVLGFTGGKA